MRNCALTGGSRRRSISKSYASPATRIRRRVSGDGAVIEYAVKMRQFPQEALASALLASGNLASSELESFAAEIATIHRAAAATDAGSTFGTPSAILDAAIQNFDQLSPLLSGPDDATAMAALRAWTVAEHDARKSLMEQRRVGGAVREGHGDLHLGNIVRIDEQLVPFDCIEFNPVPALERCPQRSGVPGHGSA